MLSFTVDNFKSFNAPNKLSMFKGNVQKKKDHVMDLGSNNGVLKGAVMYGSNAGGKTSFIDAMEMSRSIILYDFPTGPFRERMGRMYCRVSESNRLRPTTFEYVFEVDGRCYMYSLSVILSELRVSEEALTEINLDADSQTAIFRRVCDGEGDKTDFESGGYFSDSEVNKLKDTISDIEDSDRTVLLYLLTFKKKYDRDSKLHVFNDVLDWFRKKLVINPRGIDVNENDAESYRIISNIIPDFKCAHFVEDDDVPAQIRDLSNKVMSGPMHGTLLIDDHIIRKDEDGIKTFRMEIYHDSCDDAFSLNDESQGTKETIRLSPILTGEMDDVTVVIDEFGSAMHPLLAKRFIELYYSIREDDRVQLIVATHHTSLMTLDLYRADEIWFVDKKDGQSELYSLLEFQPRTDAAIDRNYYAGRYGALPLFDQW